MKPFVVLFLLSLSVQSLMPGTPNDPPAQTSQRPRVPVEKPALPPVKKI